MKKERLKRELVKMGIPDVSFSVEGIKDGECYCLVQEKDTWKVVYNSRGNIIEIQQFDSEEEACAFMYEEFRREYR